MRLLITTFNSPNVNLDEALTFQTSALNRHYPGATIRELAAGRTRV